MVHIEGFELGHQRIGYHQVSIRAFVQPVTSLSGEVRVHLSTFGSPHRETQAKSSQSLQFDRESARDLVLYLRSVFGDDLGRDNTCDPRPEMRKTPE